MQNLYFDLRQLKYLGEGAVVGKAVRIRRPEECMIGEGTIIDDFAYVSCVIEVGKHCHIASHVSISGGAGRFIMGNYSTISNHCSVHCASSDYARVSLELPSVPHQERFGGFVGDVTIGDYVVIGAHSCILPGSRLPHGSAFGAFSLVRGNEYRPMGLYAGIPASFQKIRTVPDNAPEPLKDLAAKALAARPGSC
jgi:acetyltransferase-like isoleucine patch superfamily enzyme